MNAQSLWYPVLIIAICALCTLGERALPFLLFRNGRVPAPVSYLGRVLPAAIIASLVVYCMRGVDLSQASSYAPQLLAALVTVLLHLWKKNSLLSILGGTLTCMLLMRFVF